MAAVNCNSVLLFFLFVAVMIQPLLAQYDKYWQQKAVEAQKATFQNYHPNPEEVTFEVNNEVHKAVKGANHIRRNLGANLGACNATNPIDQCWRCHPDWNENRQRLADCAIGFGRGTTGGKGGKIYVVTDPSDDDMENPKPGTLRHAVIQKEPLWITFASSMSIKLKQELIMAGDKTIDGRGANVHVANGAGITIQFVKNVIIHGLHIHDTIATPGGKIRDSVDHIGIRTPADGDGISIFGSTNVWIDHVSMSNCKDGLIDAIMGSTAITISNCHFTHHNDVILFGASDTHVVDKQMQITVAFNHFGEGLIQRMPRCRLGFFHVVNNDYFHWQMYAIGGSGQPTIISQGNRFIAPDEPRFKQVTARAGAPESEWKNWQWTSDGDLMENGAVFVQSGPPFKANQFPNMVDPKPGAFAADLTRYAGALDCVPNSPC